MTIPQAFIKHFDSKTQLPGFYISGALFENGLKLCIQKCMLKNTLVKKTLDHGIWTSDNMLHVNLWVINHLTYKKQPPKVVYKKAVRKNFTMFMRKHLCWSVFSIKLQAFRPITLLKRESNTGYFLWILQNFQEHLFWRTSANGCFWHTHDIWHGTYNHITLVIFNG